MNRNQNREQHKNEPYVVTRRYWGTRSAEDVVAALVKAHA